MSIVSKYKDIIEDLTQSKLVIVTTYLMLLSYFYNLSVLNYSIKGNNELRLYDLAGIAVFYIYIKNYGRITYIIKEEKTIRYFYRFLQWTTFTWFFTLFFSVAMGRIVWAIQSILYLYHFWVFFLAAVLLLIIIQDLRQLKRIVNVTLILSSITFFIVLLQNMGIVPHLWSQAYISAYSFLSGTLGPNKIVLGMSCFFVLALGIGILNEKSVKINKILLIVAISLALITLVISGSRTTYVALGIFLAVFSILKTKNFIYSGIVFTIMISLLSMTEIGILDKAMETYEQRVEGKMRDEDSLKEGNVDELYEDLGSGRKQLSLMYIEYLKENPLFIPFGIGFNNRLLIGSSAHNIYLSLINEVGLVGFILYFRWLIAFMFVKLKSFSNFKTALIGLIAAMLVTLLFGEHLYVYRPLFGLFGLFLFVTTILLSPHYIIKKQINDV